VKTSVDGRLHVVVYDCGCVVLSATEVLHLTINGPACYRQRERDRGRSRKRYRATGVRKRLINNVMRLSLTLLNLKHFIYQILPISLIFPL